MSNSKLFGLIQSFSEEEKEQFPVFLKSPFFLAENKSEEMIQLFGSFLNAANDSTNIRSDKAGLFKAAFGENTYSEARQERARTKLSQLIEQFLIIRHYIREENASQQALDLLGILRRKRLDNQFQKKLQQLKKETHENQLESSEHYKFKYRLMFEEHEWASLFNNGNGFLAIPDVVQNLDLFYWTTRTELKNRFKLQQNFAPFETPEIFNLDTEYPLLSTHYEQLSPLLAIRKEIHQLFSKPAPEKQDFERLLELISVNEHRISNQVIPELYTYIRNFCTLLVNNGHSEMTEVLLKIYQDNLSGGFLYYKGHIPPHAFLNITLIALASKNIEWANQFVTAHQFKILGKEGTEDLYSLNLALCFFESKQYDQALQHLTFPALFPVYMLVGRRLELKIYYETKSELLLYKADAFRKYLERTARTSMSANQRNIHLKFLNILLQLAQSRSKDPRRSNLLLSRIESKKPMADRIWLIEKARELA